MPRYFEIKSSYRDKCENCGRIVDKYAEQECHSLQDGRWVVGYEAGYFCDCGLTAEPHGFNQTPKYIRDVLIEEHGLWSLDIGEAAENREKLLSLFAKLRRRINFTVLRQLPPLQGIIAEGTLAEMKCLQMNFEEYSIPSSISRKQ